MSDSRKHAVKAVRALQSGDRKAFAESFKAVMDVKAAEALREARAGEVSKVKSTGP